MTKQNDSTAGMALTQKLNWYLNALNREGYGVHFLPGGRITITYKNVVIGRGQDRHLLSQALLQAMQVARDDNWPRMPID